MCARLLEGNNFACCVSSAQQACGQCVQLWPHVANPHVLQLWPSWLWPMLVPGTSSVVVSNVWPKICCQHELVADWSVLILTEQAAGLSQPELQGLVLCPCLGLCMLSCRVMPCQLVTLTSC